MYHFTSGDKIMPLLRLPSSCQFYIIIPHKVILRSSRPEVFCIKGVVRNFAKFTGKHQCQSLFFDKVAGDACNFIKKETLAQVFFCEFWEIYKNTFFYRTPLVPASVLRAFCKLFYFWWCFSSDHWKNTV